MMTERLKKAPLQRPDWLRGRQLNPGPLGYRVRLFGCSLFCFLGIRCCSLQEIGKHRRLFPTTKSQPKKD